MDARLTGNATIGVDVNEGLLLDDLEAEGIELVGQTEFLEDQDRLPRIGPRSWRRVSMETGY